MKQSKVRRNSVPVVKDIGNSLETTCSHSSRAGVTAIDGPKHEVALVRIQLQEQHHSLTTQLMNLKETITEPLYPLFQSVRNYAAHSCNRQRIKETIAVHKMLQKIRKLLLLSCPASLECCPATCKGSHQRKVQRCQPQVHNTTLQTLPGTSHILSGYG